jgi:hypothetical protein
MPIAGILPPAAQVGAQQIAGQAQAQNPLVPNAPGVQGAAGTNPAAAAANQSQWAKILEQMTEPGFQSALIGLGSRLLQPRPDAQTNAG